MTTAKRSATHFHSSNVVDYTPFEDPIVYRSTVGTFQYATITRPDIAFAVNESMSEDAISFHYRLFKRSISLQLQAYSNVDWAGDITDMRSNSGLAIFLGPNLIYWYFRKQKTVS
ncbi:uncharacterized protein LOC113273228 [Papaver somniferum]|uniref:uncharacterized protein LOC113273228 n=1 Tax=Papaver somniferum TaxID=3469 RepID=UPI000E6F6CD8|nr:uncharacterized protein LOC113273228 [Papaver somniferum]